MDAIVVDGVSKVFRMGVGRARGREMLPWPVDRAVSGLFPRWWLKDTFKALDDVSLSVPSGSTLGIVGHNGAGKTTLLKTIARVLAPTSGSIRVHGRTAALLDLLAGFHPELTGRENIYLLGAIYGIGRRAMASRVDQILDFAEVREWADTPLKRYSAGMGVRLGFATITGVDVDILLIDEVLAVGDSNFQRKCVRWLDEFRDRGGTLLFVSHNLALIRHMTERTVWLDHGKVVGDGATAGLLAEYAKAMERRSEGDSLHRRGNARKLMRTRGLHRWGAGGARVEEVNIDEDAETSGLDVTITYEATDLDRAVFCLGFVDEGGRDIAAAASPPFELNGGGVVRCSIRPVPFRQGIYFPVVGILSLDGDIRDRWRLDRAIVVDQDGEARVSETFGPVDIASSWQEA